MVNSISKRGGADYAHEITTGTPGPKALIRKELKFNIDFFVEL